MFILVQLVIIVFIRRKMLMDDGNTGQVGRTQGRADRLTGQGSGHPTPESKTHKGTPLHAGIGIEIPSPYIPASQVVPEFFSQRVCGKFFLLGNWVNFVMAENFSLPELAES